MGNFGGIYALVVGGVLSIMFGPVLIGAAVESFLDRTPKVRRPIQVGPPPVLRQPRPWLGRLGRWLVERSGVQVVRYDWQYLDAAGVDVTDRVHTGEVQAVTALAMEAGKSRVLLRVTRDGGVWRLARKGGHLGEQVSDAAMWTRGHADPYAAMAAVAGHLRFTALETV